MTNSEQQNIRLRQLLDALSMTQKAFADSIGLSQGFLTQVLSGKKGISGTIMAGITIGYRRVNLHWLLSGEGKMFLDDVNDNSAVMEPAAAYHVSRRPIALNDLESVILDLINRVNTLERRDKT